MKIEYINPFLNAVDNAMKTMVGVSPERDKPYLKENRSTTGDITGIIGFAEKRISGSVALSFPTKTILKIYELMMGDSVEEINDEVDDIVGELTNIVVGGAKKDFSELGLPFNISLPLVVSGKNHIIKHKHDNPVMVIPYSVEGNKFVMEISLLVK